MWKTRAIPGADPQRRKLNNAGLQKVLTGTAIDDHNNQVFNSFLADPITSLEQVRRRLGPTHWGFCIDADPPFAADTGRRNNNPPWVWLHAVNEQVPGPGGNLMSLEDWRSDREEPHPEDATQFLTLAEFTNEHDRLPRARKHVVSVEEQFVLLYKQDRE